MSYYNNSTFVTDCECMELTQEEYSEVYVMYNFFVVILAMPVITLLGVVGNIINIFIFTRLTMRHSSANVYLTALAISDLMVVLTGLLMFWVDSVRSYFPILDSTPDLLLHALPIALIAQTCSVYMIVAAAVDCFVNAYFLQRYPWYCTSLTATRVVIAVALCSTAYNSLRFGQFVSRQCTPEEGFGLIVEICPTSLYKSVNEFYNVFLYVLVLTLVPFALLSVLNILIIRRQRYVQKLRFEQTLMRLATTASAVVVNEGPEPDDPRVMIMVVLLFLGCNTLALVINIVETFFGVSVLVLHYMTDASNLLVMINSTVNICIYFQCSPDYHHLFCHYFRLICCCAASRCVAKKDVKKTENGKRSCEPISGETEETTPAAIKHTFQTSNNRAGSRKLRSANLNHEECNELISTQKTNGVRFESLADNKDCDEEHNTEYGVQSLNTEVRLNNPLSGKNRDLTMIICDI